MYFFFSFTFFSFLTFKICFFLTGSIIITWSISAPTDESDLIAAQIQALIELQLETPGSILLSGLVTRLINTQKTLPLLVLLSEASSSVVEIDGVIIYIDDKTGTLQKLKK